MSALKLSKAWSINPNVRNAFVSLTDMAGWWIYENHAFLITKNWTVKFTSDGVTADGNDNLPNKTAASIRGANTTTPQSFTVLTNPDGVDLLITYQGATDDVIKIAFSPGGLYALAGTPTHQPTASDEVIWCQGNSVVNATASADRVMTIWASDDGKNWCNALWRVNTLQSVLGLERVNSFCAPGVHNKPYIAFRYNNLVRSNSPGGNGPTFDPTSTAAGAAGWFGTLARVVTDGATRTTRCGAGTIAIPSSIGNNLVIEESMLSNTPALQGGGMPMLPLFLTGEKAASLDGFLGTPQDWWVGYASTTSIPAVGDVMPGYEPADIIGVDPVRSNWFVALGSTMIRPWRDSAPSLQTI